MTDLIARSVGAMLRKLHAEAVVGTLVHADDVAFHDEPSPKRHVVQLGYHLGMQVFAFIDRGHAIGFLR